MGKCGQKVQKVQDSAGWDEILPVIALILSLITLIGLIYVQAKEKVEDRSAEKLRAQQRAAIDQKQGEEE